MSLKSIDYLANAPTASALGSASTQRGPSEIIWGAPGERNAWVEDFIQDPSLGMQFFDDFEASGYAAAAAAAFAGSFGKWSIYLGSTGVLTDASIIGGGLTMTPGTAASNNPVALGSLTGCFQIMSASSAAGLQGRLAFEARVALQSVTASQRDAFVGLCDVTTPAITCPFTAGTSTNQLTSTRNLIGFYNPYSGGGQDWQFVFQLASTAPVFVTNMASLCSKVGGSAIVAGTYYKLGFVYDPYAPTLVIGTAANGQTVGVLSKAMLRVFVNGVPAAAFLTSDKNILTASFPTGVMGPMVSIINETSSVGASTNAGALLVDWVRVAQTGIT